MMESSLFTIALLFAIWFGTFTLIKAIFVQTISTGTIAVMATSLTLALTHIIGIW